MKKLKVLNIVGARPQIIKASAISRAIAGEFAGEIDEVVVHTGQHYDRELSRRILLMSWRSGCRITTSRWDQAGMAARRE
ncbi:MAG: hypothetical protein U5L72_11465 [Bacteroidales bacterium]|nr:hypothetical protein [Bacteroidales bacterium]